MAIAPLVFGDINKVKVYYQSFHPPETSFPLLWLPHPAAVLPAGPCQCSRWWHAPEPTLKDCGCLSCRWYMSHWNTQHHIWLQLWWQEHPAYFHCKEKGRQQNNYDFSQICGSHMHDGKVNYLTLWFIKMQSDIFFCSKTSKYSFRKKETEKKRG